MKIKNTGLTLVEIMIVLSILGIVSAIAFPTMLPIIRENRVKSETRKVVNNLKLARMTSLKDVAETTVSIENSKQITVKQTGSDGKEKIIRQINVEYSAVYITASPTSVTFRSDGTLKYDSNAAMPDIVVSDGVSEYYISVKLSGLASVEPMKQI